MNSLVRRVPTLSRRIVESHCRLFSQSATTATTLAEPLSSSSFASSLSNDTTTNTTSDSSNNNDGGSSRLSVLQSSLPYVHTYGWTEDAISQGVLSSQLPPSLAGLVTPQDLVSHFMNQANADLERHLEERRNNNNDSNNSNPSQEIQYAIRHRLEMVIPYLQSQTWHEGMALGATSNTTATANELDELVSIVTRHALSNSATLVTPVHRLALGAVYVTTELHLLTDTSPGYAATWEFLAQRLQECAKVAQGDLVGLPNAHMVTGAAAVASSLATAVLSLVLPGGVRGVVDTAATGASDLVRYMVQQQEPFEGISMNGGGFGNSSRGFSSATNSSDIKKDLPPFEKPNNINKE